MDGVEDAASMGEHDDAAKKETAPPLPPAVEASAAGEEGTATGDAAEDGKKEEEEVAQQTMPGWKIAGICCVVATLITGIILLVAGLMGYLTFEDPCLGASSVQVIQVEVLQNVQEEPPEEEESNNNGGGGLMGAAAAAGAAVMSGVTNQLGLPTHAEMLLNLILEVNNTNVYKIDYEQGDHEGIVLIPAEGTGLNQDMIVGNYSYPAGTLPKESTSNIPLILNVDILLTNSELATFSKTFVTGGPMSFRILGGIDGRAWVPGLEGTITFECAIEVENVLNVKDQALVWCLQNIDVGPINMEKSFESLISELERDPACYV